MDSVPLSPVVSASLADQVYARLRAAVQDGSLRRGQKITERDLAARLEVSPTPVREALRQLIHERVVERTGLRSLRIADYGAEAVREVAEMEARLCGLAARFAARKRSDALLAELARDLDEADGLVATVGSTSDVALYQELGTARLPPRPFLAPAAAENGDGIAQAIGQAVFDALKP